MTTEPTHRPVPDVARALTRAIAAVGAAGLGCVAYGTIVERRWYRLREVELPGVLEPGVDRPLRILHVSDIHLDPPQQHRVDFLRSLTGQEYDLVVATGDLLGAQHAEETTAAILGELTRPEVPGLVVLGSNDLYGPIAKSPFGYFTDPQARRHGARLDTELLVALLEARGYTVLRNEATVIETRSGPVDVGGIDDPHLPTTVIPPVEALRSGVPEPALHLGLVHAPYTAALDQLVAAGHRLLLSGHTHGGQVRFPPIGAVVANCDLPLDQARGVSRWGDACLHVSPGLGHSRYAPFRFACRPEATILHCTA